jgi:hypothetical protein
LLLLLVVLRLAPLLWLLHGLPLLRLLLLPLLFLVLLLLLLLCWWAVCFKPPHLLVHIQGWLNITVIILHSVLASGYTCTHTGRGNRQQWFQAVPIRALPKHCAESSSCYKAQQNHMRFVTAISSHKRQQQQRLG